MRLLIGWALPRALRGVTASRAFTRSRAAHQRGLAMVEVIVWLALLLGLGTLVLPLMRGGLLDSVGCVTQRLVGTVGGESGEIGACGSGSANLAAVRDGSPLGTLGVLHGGAGDDVLAGGGEERLESTPPREREESDDVGSIAACVARDFGGLVDARPAADSACPGGGRHASGTPSVPLPVVSRGLRESASGPFEFSIFPTRGKDPPLDDALPGSQFAAADGVPGGTTDASSAGRRFIGYIYHAEGTLDGERVQYTGSTSRELRKRFSGHVWRAFLRDPMTRIIAYEVLADPRADLSNRGTLRSAESEALRAVEEIHRSQTSQNERLKELNLRRAALPENIQRWIDGHSVVVGEGRLVPRGFTLRALGGVVTLLDALKFGRDRRIAGQGLVQFPAVLADERGHFTVLSRKGPMDGLWGNEYWKFYVDGDAQGQNVPLTRDEYDLHTEEAEALYGYLDLFGEFQPGLLNPTLQRVELPPDVY